MCTIHTVPSRITKKIKTDPPLFRGEDDSEGGDEGDGDGDEITSSMMDAYSPPIEWLEEGLLYLKNKKTELKFGDLVIFLQVEGYRNSGFSIYDGVKLLPLSTDLDEYGHLPKKFQVIRGGIEIDHWSFIRHNNIVWYDFKENIHDLIFNIEPGEEPSASFHVQLDHPHQKKKYFIIFEQDVACREDLRYFSKKEIANILMTMEDKKDFGFDRKRIYRYFSRKNGDENEDERKRREEKYREEDLRDDILFRTIVKNPSF